MEVLFGIILVFFITASIFGFIFALVATIGSIIEGHTPRFIAWRVYKYLPFTTRFLKYTAGGISLLEKLRKVSPDNVIVESYSVYKFYTFKDLELVIKVDYFGDAEDYLKMNKNMEVNSFNMKSLTFNFTLADKILIGNFLTNNFKSVNNFTKDLKDILEKGI